MKADTTGARVYDHLTKHMDEDGLCELSSHGIALSLGLPPSTCQKALLRLDNRGMVVRLGTAQYVVVSQAVLDDPE